MEPYTNYTLNADDYYESKMAEEQADELNDQLIELGFNILNLALRFIQMQYNESCCWFSSKMKLLKSMGKLRKMNRTSNFEASLIDRIGFDAGAERKTDLIEK